MTNKQEVQPRPYDTMTRAEYIAMIAKIYDVPMDLLRYDVVHDDHDSMDQE